MKLRPTTSFNNAISDARRVFGCDDNNTSQICRRALRAYADGKFQPVITHDKTVGNPITIKCDTELNAKDFISIVIGYVQWQIEKSSRRQSPPLILDESETTYEVIPNAD